MLATRIDRNVRRAPRRGFTLIEVLLVLAILGVIAAMVVPRLMGRQQESYIRATRTSIRGVEKALDLYAFDRDGQYPEGGQEVLTQLLQVEEVGGQTFGPYLTEPALDAWGTQMFYQYPGRNNQQVNKPDIWSAGPNRQDDQGSGDDINNWDTAQQQY